LSRRAAATVSWRFSLKTHQRERYLQVDALAMHVAADGIYYETPYSASAGQVFFQPFAPHSAPVKYVLGPHRAWSVLRELFAGK